MSKETQCTLCHKKLTDNPYGPDKDTDVHYTMLGGGPYCGKCYKKMQDKDDELARETEGKKKPNFKKMVEKMDERRHPLTEAEGNIVQKAVNAIFAAIANRKTKAIQAMLMKTPEFAASVQRLQSARDEMEKELQKTVYKRKGHKEFEDWYEKNIAPFSK